MTRVTQLIHDAGKYLLISVYPLPTHSTHNFTHNNGGNLETLPGWPKKLQHNRPARSAGQWWRLHGNTCRNAPAQQIGVHEASLRVLLVLEILCSSPIICVDVVGMLCFPCIWLRFIGVSFEFTLGSRMSTFSLRCYRAHGELKMVSNQHIVNTKISRTHTSTNLLGGHAWIPPEKRENNALMFFFIPVILSKLLTKPSQYRWFDKLWGPSDVIVILHIFIPYLFISSVRPITTSHATRGKPMNRETWRSPHGHKGNFDKK